MDMAADIKGRKRARRSPNSPKLIARLRAEIARLRAELRRLKGDPNGTTSHARGDSQAHQPDAQVTLLALPVPDAEGFYPATETIRAILAQQIIRRRRAAGWTQAELARRARVRQETISRLESGKHAPNVTTVDKIDQALKKVGV